MELTDFISFLGILGVVAVAYSGFVHTRLHQAETVISDFRERVAENYLNKEVGNRLFSRLDDIDTKLAAIDKAVAVFIAGHKKEEGVE